MARTVVFSSECPPLFVHSLNQPTNRSSSFRAINTNTGAVVALKYQKPPNNWELYICREVRKKITNYDMVGYHTTLRCVTLRQINKFCNFRLQLLGFMDISTAIIAPNASIFVTEFSPYGSLLDINNRIRQGTTKVKRKNYLIQKKIYLLSLYDHFFFFTR